MRKRKPASSTETTRAGDSARRYHGTRYAGRSASGRSALLTVLTVLTTLILANTLYLLANRLIDAWRGTPVGDSGITLSRFYQVMLLSHTGLGLLLALLAITFVIWHLSPVWLRRSTRTVATGVFVLIGMLTLAGTGLFIMTAAASRDNGWIWWIHVSVAAGLLIAYPLHRIWSSAPPPARAWRSLATAVAGLAVLAVVGHTLTPHETGRRPGDGAATASEDRRMESSLAYHTGREGRPALPWMPAADVPTASLFYPAGTTTTTGGWLPEKALLQEHAGNTELPQDDFSKYGFIVSTLIGAESCGRCHADIVAQWASSAHRFASFNNPFYEATINLLRETATDENEPILEHMAKSGIPRSRLAQVRSKWCSGCHDPALMIAGKMSDDIDRRSVAAQAGLTCLACHAIDAIHNNTGNGHYNIPDEQEDPYLFAGHDSGAAAFLHDTALKARPAVHKQQMLKPFFRDSEFCAVCHKVSLDLPVNNYRWIRGQDEYDNWHDSGVARNASRTFYLPENKRVCQDCHMPPELAVLGDVSARNGYVKSHRFLAVNTALPFVRGDVDGIERTEAFMRDHKLRVDVFALRVLDGDETAESVYPIDRMMPTIPAGCDVQVDVVVRNLNVGHTFPGGTIDSNQGWLEVSLLDDAGGLLGVSGAIGDDGRVDPDAHFYRAVMVGHDGRRIFRRDAHNIHAAVYTRVIGPGTADVAHFEFEVPAELAGGALTIRVRLLWRKFDRAYTEFAFEANRDAFAMFDAVPDLPVTEIAAVEVTLPIGHAGSIATTAEGSPVEWTRYNDYGIGLLLQGNTRAAADAFRQLIESYPDRVDGYRNLARVARVEGDLDGAYESLRKAEDITPGDPQTAWVWGQVLTEDGRYDEAIKAYRRVLETFPEDRAAWRELAVVHYRNHQFDDSMTAGEEVLRIDPEDRIAHYYKMLSLRALGREAEAEAARSAYEHYQIDESALEITTAHRLAHPANNLEAQAVHVHRIELQGFTYSPSATKGVNP